MSRFFSNKFLNISIKIVLLGLLAWVIYLQVFALEDWQDLKAQLFHPKDQRPWYFLLLTIILIPINWGLETKKWLSLLPSDFGLSFQKSLRAVLVGIAISLLTPNRVGEYGGRILLVQGRKRWEAVIGTLVGSMAQLLVLLTGGIFGLLFYGARHLDLDPWKFQLSLVGVVLVVLTGLYIFFNIARFEGLISRIAKRFKWAKHLLRIGEYTPLQLLHGIQWASLRYLTYVLQYLLILYFFGVNPPVLQGLAAIAMIYLIQTSIPLPPLVSLFARGEIALLVWSVYSEESAAILAASLSLFILNLTIPALLGAAILVQINVLKSLGYGNSE